MNKINIGSGLNVIKGWDNLDLHSTHGANIVHDLTNLPLPLKTNHYDKVLCSHVLEDFTDPLPLFNELLRITKPKGIIHIKVPSHTTLNIGNKYHKHSFTIGKLLDYANTKSNYDEKSQSRLPARKKSRAHVKTKTRRKGLGLGNHWC